MAPTTKPKPTDATGIARAKGIEKNAAELKLRAAEITTLAAVEAMNFENNVFDPLQVDPTPIIEEVLDPSTSKSDPAATHTSVDEIVTTKTGLADDSVIIRLTSDIETMTWGHGNTYSFKAGLKYKVPQELANHLETLGYLYGV